MSPIRDERGFTLVELMITMVIAMLLFGGVLAALGTMLTQGRKSDKQAEAQDSARQTMETLSRGLRNSLAAPSAAPATVERIDPYDLIIQTVDLATAPSAGNPLNAMRVRYCLDATDAANGVMHTQTQRWTTTAPPAMPTGAACPAAGWTDDKVVSGNLTNRRAGQTRPLFECWPQDPATPGTCPATPNIRAIRSSLFVDADPTDVRGERDLTSTAFLRNANRPPVASFSVSQANGYVSLNASASYDPDGDSLEFEWRKAGAPIAGATGPEYSASGLVAGTTVSFTLVVRDRGGLSGLSTREVLVK